MSRCYVGNLMSNNRGQFGFRISESNEAAVNVHIPPRQRERIDFGAVNEGKSKSQVRAFTHLDQAVTDTGNVGKELLILKHRHAGHDLLMLFKTNLLLPIFAHQYQIWLSGRRINSTGARQRRYQHSACQKSCNPEPHGMNSGY